jgi:CubicO group peptidase (beta-lactamase class C family)
MKKQFFSLLSLCVFSASDIAAQTPEIKSMDSLMNLYFENNFFNGEILVAVNSKPIYTKTVGFRDYAKKEKLMPNSIFNIGSVSKPFTAVAVLQLQEKKRLDIGDKVKKYIPSFPYENICIKHLLSHTSGISANLDFMDEGDMLKKLNNDDILPMLVKYRPPLQCIPGDRWIYSNLGYDLLALVVEQVTQMDFFAYVGKYIFQPSGMKQSFIPSVADPRFWLPETINEQSIALPHSYKNITSCEVTNLDLIYNSKAYFVGSGNVYTTVCDLIKFDEALSKNIILSKASQELAYTPYELNNGDLAKDSLAPIASYYGLGWDISIDQSWGRIIWHKGRSGGTRSIFLRNHDRMQTVVAFDNFDHTSCDLKAIACLKTINHRVYRNPVFMSLVQRLGCGISTKGFEEAQKDFIKEKETKRANYFISKDELVELASVLNKKQDFEDALSVLKLGQELFPDSWLVQVNYANLLLGTNQVEEAIRYYKLALSFFSTNGEKRNAFLGNIGSQFIDEDKLDNAEIVLKLNTEIFPDDCNSYDNYAFILDRNNKLDQAILVQEKAVRIAKGQNHELLKTFEENLERLKEKK